MIQPLADNLDLPGRLAPSVSAVLKHRDGQSYDRRVDIRAGLTEMVALYADALAPDADLPEPVDAGNRDRLATAVTRAYAAFATPRLTPGLFQNGRPDDLGRFPPPVLEGDPAAARAMALAIGARIARGEEYVLNHLVAAGHGGAAQAAAGLLLRERPEYKRLPDSQKVEIARQMARDIESGFAVRDLRQAATRELTEEMENRRVDIAGGAGAINAVSAMATQELHQLQEDLQKIRYWEEPGVPVQPGLPAQRPESVIDLVERVQGAVGELTAAPESLWNGEIQPWPDMTGPTSQSADGTFGLSRDGALQLYQLTQRGADQLDPEQLRAARETLQDVTAAYARWAVPAGQPRQEFTSAQLAVSEQFAADNFNDVVRRTLPPELAAQVMTPEAPPVGTARGQVARGFANAVDNLKGLDTRPSESLRLMAGSADIGATAGEVLVTYSELPAADRQAAVQAIAASVERGFDELPTDATPSEALIYGQELGRKANAHTFPAGSSARFGAADPALTRPRTVQTAAATPSTTTKATDQPGKTLDR
jgi:hypothetical protein